MYATGDRVRYAEGGALEFQGRIDGQVKLRGHRIELGEVEAVLLAHPGLANGAVVLRGEADAAELVAYLVSSTKPEPPDAELREWLSERLPRYMSVSRIVWLSALPLTLNGKVDRARLPQGSGAPDRVPLTPPRTGLGRS
jgi:acyl-coenzyme A synthetase/AMP-(fatty) acid ligase